MRRIREFLFRPLRALAAGAEGKDEFDRNAFEEARVATAAAMRDSRLFDLAEVVVVGALAAVAGIWANSCGFAAGVQVLLIVVGGVAGWLLVPLLWWMGCLLRAPVKQRDNARNELRALRQEKASDDAREQAHNLVVEAHGALSGLLRSRVAAGLAERGEKPPEGAGIGFGRKWRGDAAWDQQTVAEYHRLLRSETAKALSVARRFVEVTNARTSLANAANNVDELWKLWWELRAVANELAGD